MIEHLDHLSHKSLVLDTFYVPNPDTGGTGQRMTSAAATIKQRVYRLHVGLWSRLREFSTDTYNRFRFPFPLGISHTGMKEELGYR